MTCVLFFANFPYKSNNFPLPANFAADDLSLLIMSHKAVNSNGLWNGTLLLQWKKELDKYLHAHNIL